MPILKRNYRLDFYQSILEVDQKEHLMRLDQFIALFFQGFSRQHLKSKIALGEVLIKGRTTPHRASTKVHAKDIVTVTIHKTLHEKEFWQGFELSLQTIPQIIYQDDNLIAINKPPFMATHPTGRHLFNCATVYLENTFNHPVHSIHRLDRETSGILLLAKNPHTANDVRQFFDDKKILKVYFFIAKTKSDVKIKLPLRFSARERLSSIDLGPKRVLMKPHPMESSLGKSAHTDFTILYQAQNYFIGLAFPKSGRQHQIRTHAMAHGFPLLGDKIYLGSYQMFQRFKDNIATMEDYQAMEIPRQALHAIAIKIPYHKKQIYRADISEDLKIWANKYLTNLSAVLKLVDQEIFNYFGQT